MPQPLAIDLEKTPWIIPSKILLFLKGIISINMIYKAYWNFTKLLFRESGKLLKNGQLLILYGPFKIGNKHVSRNNDLFDCSFKLQNKLWGVRDFGEVSEEATKYGFIKEELFHIPINNFSVIYRKIFS